MQLQAGCERDHVDRKRCAAGLALIVFTLIFVLAGCGQSSFTVDEHLDRATEFETRGELNAAIIELKNALQKDPDHAQARLRLGKLLLEVFDGRGAELELTRARDLGMEQEALRIPFIRAWLLQGKDDQVVAQTEDPHGFPRESVPEVLALRGLALLSRGDMEGSMRALEAALDLNPEQVDALMGRAWLAAGSGDFDAAFGWIDRALAVNPRWGLALELRGDLERRLGRLDEAEESFTEAMNAGQRQVSPRLKRAMVRMAKQEMEAAREDLVALERRGSRHPGVYHGLGVIAFMNGHYPEAQGHFEMALAESATFMPSVLALGITHLMQENWSQAESRLRRFSEAHPHSAEGAQLLALARIRSGDVSRAERTLRAALSRTPDDVAALNLIANVYLGQGMTDEAVRHLRRVAELNPDSALARERLGLAMFMGGDVDGGLSELEAASRMDPGIRQADVMAITEYLGAGRYQDALEAAQRLQEKDADSPVGYNFEGLAHIGLGDAEAARDAFKQALERQPGGLQPGMNLAQLEMRLGNVDTARDILVEVLHENPAHPDPSMLLARIERQAGRQEQALDLLRRSLEAHRESVSARINLARFHAEAGRHERALEVLHDADEAMRDAPRLLSAIGDIYLALGRDRDALSAFNRWVDVQPDSADAYYHLARAHHALGNTAQSEAAVERALDIDPHHVLAGLNRIRRLEARGQGTEARRHLAELQRRHPANPNVHAQSGHFALAEGRPRDATTAYVMALQLSDRPQRDWIMGLARAQVALDRLQQAASVLDSWNRTVAGDAEALAMEGELQMRLGNEQAARERFAQVLEAAPDHVAALNNLAWLLRRENPEAALEYAEQAVSLAPESAQALDTKGVILMLSGRNADAVPILRKAHTLAPAEPVIQLHLVEALLGDGRHSESRQTLERLLSEHDTFEGRDQAVEMLERLRRDGH